MPSKGKVKPQRFDMVAESKLVMRFAEVRAETANHQERTIQAVIASENPVRRYDEERGIVVDEVLEMDGIEWRGGRRQLPIVDSHDRSTVANVLGSVRNLRVEGDELVGDIYFASDDESQRAFQKLVDGHLTDFSITASPMEIGFVERGQQYTTRRGGVVDGPADIVSRWMPTDASLVATGADSRSVVRRSYTVIPEDIRRMDESTIKSLVDLGMPADVTDPGAALTWVLGYMSAMKPGEVEVAEPIESADAMSPEQEEEPMAQVENADMAPKEEELKMAVDRALKADGQRRREIHATCEKLKLERSFADQLCDQQVPLDEARKQIIERAANKPVGQTGGSGVRVTESEDDKFNAAVSAGLISRAYQGAKLRGKTEAVEGSKDFERLSLGRVAEVVLRRSGVNTDRMSQIDICKVAMGNREACRRHGIERTAYHTTGSFPNLLLDAANKTLLQAYEEAPFTWNLWARQAPSVADFKNINRVRFSESPDPEMVPERAEYKEKTMSDSKESYKVEKYGALFTVSWETVVNDDLDAISRIPAMHGAACRRKVNKEVYAVLTANPTMGDSVALFGSHSSGTNLSGAAANPSVSTLNTSFAAMMKQKGLSSDVIISVQPRYLIVPVALGATALELVNSTSYVLSNSNSGVQNIYGVGGTRSLTVVEEATLDGNSTTAWYLAADPSQIDTVEVSFLQGEESPVLEDEWDFDHDVYKYKVRQTFGVKAIDWRGLYKYATA